jgi:Ceramidase
LDLYCERLDAGLLAEPLNALTNLAFLYTACLAWRVAGARLDLRMLAALLAAIGLGSALFHTLATPLAQLCDVLPIALLQLLYLYLYLRRVVFLGQYAAQACLLLYVLALVLASRTGAVLNGSLAYAPAALVLCILGTLHYRLRASGDVLAAALLFLVSLVARSVDLVLCEQWPLGTHFLWHLLNAVVLAVLLRAYRIASEVSPPPATGLNLTH